MIPLHDEIEKTCQFNQSTRAFLRMSHFHDTVPLSMSDHVNIEFVFSIIF